MIIHKGNYVIISQNSNDVYWEQGFYPDWTALNAFRYFPNQMKGTGVEPHYHDNDEIWLFAAGRGEVWLDEQRYEITPNTVVYTPMGVVHRFQMFTDYDNIALVTRLERQKRPIHILVEEVGPPVPTVPGFVVPGGSNTGPFIDRGRRCPLSELRQLAFAAGETVKRELLSANEHWLVLDGDLQLLLDGWEIELSRGDVALLKASTVRQIGSAKGARVALARE